MRLPVDSNVIERHCEWLTCEQQVEQPTRVIAEPYIMNRVEDSFGPACFLANVSPQDDPRAGGSAL